MAEDSTRPGPAAGGRPKAYLALTADERATLAGWADGATVSDPVALRARIILACATGATNTDVANHVTVSRPTVGRWRRRFIDKRLDGLVDEPRSGRPPSVTPEQIEEILKATTDPPPQRHRTWSRREMARRTGLSASTVGGIWKEFDLTPHKKYTD